MKGVVLEVRDGCSAILLEDGTVVKRPTTYGIGETVEISASVTKMPVKSRLSRIVAAVAAFTVVFTGGGTYAYLDATAMSQVSLDVNPSLEYELNHFDRVVSVKDENADAKEVVDLLNEDGVKGDTLTEALAKTEDILKDLGYLAEDEDPYILVSVCSGSEKKYAALTAEIEQQLSSESYNVTVLAISEENKKEAEELGISGGRYAIMKSDEEKLSTAKADEKEVKPAVPEMEDPLEYYKTSAVKTLIEGIIVTDDSLTIDDDDTIKTEVADASEKPENTGKKDQTVAATEKPVDTSAATAPADTATQGADEAADVSAADTSGTKSDKTDTSTSQTSDQSVVTDETVVTTDETVSTTDEEQEDIVSTGDDEVDGDAPIDMSKLG